MSYSFARLPARPSWLVAVLLLGVGCVLLSLDDSKKVDAPIKGGDAIARLYRSTNRVHDDGTLRTRHVTTNVIVDIDEDAGSAAVRSAFVVLQQTPTLPLQPIVTGRYRDRFERFGGTWRFAARHIVVDHVGEVREHLSFELAAFRAEHPT